MVGQIKCFPDQVKLNEIVITQPILYEMLKVLYKKKIKTMNTKMTTNSELPATKPKNKNKNKLSK